MDCRARRSRRRRACSGGTPRESHQPWSFIDSFSSFLIVSCLIGLIYLMMENHCKTCNSNNCDLNNINKSIADIAKTITSMKHKYRDLELKVSRFSVEIPKLEGHFELIEAITSAIDRKDGWDPRRCLPLPNVDVFLNTPPCHLGNNVTCDNNIMSIINKNKELKRKSSPSSCSCSTLLGDDLGSKFLETSST